MAQIREKWNYSFWVELTFGWYEGIVVFFISIFVFLFRTDGQKERLDESNFRHCYGKFFESDVLKVSCSQLCSKFFLNNNKAHWQRDLRDILQLKIMRKWISISANRSWINICAKHAVNKILSWLRMMKQKLTEKIQYSEVHCTKIEDDTSTYYCMLLFLLFLKQT